MSHYFSRIAARTGIVPTTNNKKSLSSHTAAAGEHVPDNRTAQQIGQKGLELHEYVETLPTKENISVGKKESIDAVPVHDLASQQREHAEGEFNNPNSGVIEGSSVMNHVSTGSVHYKDYKDNVQETFGQTAVLHNEKDTAQKPAKYRKHNEKIKPLDNKSSELQADSLKSDARDTIAPETVTKKAIATHNKIALETVAKEAEPVIQQQVVVQARSDRTPSDVGNDNKKDDKNIDIRIGNISIEISQEQQQTLAVEPQGVNNSPSQQDNKLTQPNHLSRYYLRGWG